MASASRGFLTNLKRGYRIFRKVAGTVCQRARQELDSRGLLWSKAAWDGSLHAAMAGLKELAGIVNADLRQGFSKVLASVTQARLEGLQSPASASRGARSIPARRAPARPAHMKQAPASASGASRKAERAREHLAAYLFGDKCESPNSNGPRIDRGL